MRTRNRIALVTGMNISSVPGKKGGNPQPWIDASEQARGQRGVRRRQGREEDRRATQNARHRIMVNDGMGMD